MIHFALLFSRQGKVRLSKYYKPYSQKERAKLVKEVTSQILARPSKLCNVVEHRNLKLIYKRYASLYFMLAVDDEENELITLEMIQHYVEILDRRGGAREKGEREVVVLRTSLVARSRSPSSSHFHTFPYAPETHKIEPRKDPGMKKGFFPLICSSSVFLSSPRTPSNERSRVLRFYVLLRHDPLRKVLRQRVRAGPHLQLSQGVLHP